MPCSSPLSAASAMHVRGNAAAALWRTSGHEHVHLENRVFWHAGAEQPASRVSTCLPSLPRRSYLSLRSVNTAALVCTAGGQEAVCAGARRTPVSTKRRRVGMGNPHVIGKPASQPASQSGCQHACPSPVLFVAAVCGHRRLVFTVVGQDAVLARLSALVSSPPTSHTPCTRGWSQREL